ncbi:MAG TPA: carboxypeptidase regulatory-like domain-containing protein [Gemmatimonadaceae bacterium]|nr:carboxypeptidase regulatory-like domain-containing protein [Gemmatimonadaceae bacterium]
MRIAALSAGLVTIAFATVTAAPAQAQPAPRRAVRGTVRDSASGQPLAGALVELRNPSDRRTVRTDEAGLFTIRGLSPGRYQLSVLRIGFVELRRDLDLAAADTTLALDMRPIAQRLAGFRVRGDTTAIYGMVASLPDLLPIRGALVQVIGDNASRTTDSTGGFFIPVSHPGDYMVRISRDGYVDRMFPVTVPKDLAVEASRMLDPGPGTPHVMDGLFADADKRLRFRGVGSAIVPGSEIRKAGGRLSDALPFTRAMSIKGLRLGPGVCLFVNGVHKPLTPIDVYDPAEIESIEVYGPRDEKSGDLAPQCISARPNIGALAARPAVSGGNVVAIMVIWLRR